MPCIYHYTCIEGILASRIIIKDGWAETPLCIAPILRLCSFSSIHYGFTSWSLYAALAIISAPDLSRDPAEEPQPCTLAR